MNRTIKKLGGRYASHEHKPIILVTSDFRGKMKPKWKRNKAHIKLVYNYTLHQIVTCLVIKLIKMSLKRFFKSLGSATGLCYEYLFKKTT